MCWKNPVKCPEPRRSPAAGSRSVELSVIRLQRMKVFGWIQPNRDSSKALHCPELPERPIRMAPQPTRPLKWSATARLWTQVVQNALRK